MITTAERELIYTEPKVVQGKELVWEHREGEGSTKLNAVVLRLNGEILSLRGTIRYRYSFALLYKGIIVIRKWDTARHKNPDGVIFIGSHKQPRKDEDDTTWAYYVDDIPTNNVGKALHAFLKECNIKVEGEYQPTLF